MGFDICDSVWITEPADSRYAWEKSCMGLGDLDIDDTWKLCEFNVYYDFDQSGFVFTGLRALQGTSESFRIDHGDDLSDRLKTYIQNRIPFQLAACSLSRYDGWSGRPISGIKMFIHNY